MSLATVRGGIVELGSAVTGEIPGIAAIPGLSAVTVRLLEGEFGRDDRCCLVARARAQVVGYGAVLQQLDEAHVTDLAVAAGWRRQGVGTALLEELVRRVRERGALAVTLEVRAGNTAAQELYRRRGFVVEGRRRGYYPDGEDALILWRHLRSCSGEER